MAEKRLTVRQIQTITRAGLHADGGGLYLRVTAGGTKSWILRYQRHGKRRDMGLGGFPAVGLALARERAAEAREVITQGGDPLAVKAEEKAAAAGGGVVAGGGPAVRSFRDAAEELMRVRRPGWRNPKHAAQWASTLETYVYGTLGNRPVGAVETADVLAVLSPIWVEKAETAARVRGRIEAVLDYAQAMGWRRGDNPARWKGNLSYLLPKRGAVAPQKHHPSLAYAALPAFWPRLSVADGLGARALEIIILSACRPGEVGNARWAEVDLQGLIWTIPPERMKAKAEHRVPITEAMAVRLRALWTLRDSADGYVFPGMVKGRPISNATMNQTLRRLSVPAVPHGFRATFRTWAADVTGVPEARPDIAEAVLAHTQGKLTAAYQRGDLFDQRRRLMEAWAGFVQGG